MNNNRIYGSISLKYHEVSISDTGKELTYLVDKVVVSLITHKDDYFIEIQLQIPELKLEETWKIGITNDFNSSETLEPFFKSIVRTSSNEFVIHFSATCNVSDSEDHHLLAFELYAKFQSTLPEQFKTLDCLYDVA